MTSSSDHRAPQGYGPATQQPVTGYPPPWPPQPPRRHRRWLGGVGGLVGMALSIAVVYGWQHVTDHGHVRDGGRDPLRKVSAGDCVKVSGGPAMVDVTTVSCDDPTTIYRVGVVLKDPGGGSCPGTDYDTVRSIGGMRNTTLCLELQVREGECVAQNSLDNSAQPVDCGTAAAQSGHQAQLTYFKIGRIIKGSTDPTACGDATDAHNAVVYPKPDPTILCLVDPGE
ncbi:hypothetical protein ACFXPS_25355 [Nocardia sp. NPDC059091]|uniref:LppU/SCO3897 family protein n=1 Tax=unclassified Nocardia TaxID=2637762 RepID=UPI0036C6DD78